MSAFHFNYTGFGFAALATGYVLTACASDGASGPPANNVGGAAGAGGSVVVPGAGGSAGPGAGGSAGPGAGGSAGPGAGGSAGPGAGGSATPGAGGAAPSAGGQQGNGGGVAVTPSDIQITGSVTQCTGTTPGTIPASLTATSCTLPQCQAATCVEQSLITQFAPDIDATALALLGTCGNATTYCVPNDFIATTGNFQTKTCTSLENAEGRCISTCVPQVLTQINTLPQGGCAAAERCAPCWNPIDGVSTGACNQGCDGGPTQPKVVFTECGNGVGVCVPKSLVTDPAQLTALESVDDPDGICADTAKVCAPKLKAADQSAPFPECWNNGLSGLAIANSAGQKFACVPSYIVPSAQKPLLNQGEQGPAPNNVPPCATGELCAPCFNPLSTPTPNAPTGACAL